MRKVHKAPKPPDNLKYLEKCGINARVKGRDRAIIEYNVLRDIQDRLEKQIRSLKTKHKI